MGVAAFRVGLMALGGPLLVGTTPLLLGLFCVVGLLLLALLEGGELFLERLGLGKLISFALRLLFQQIVGQRFVHASVSFAPSWLRSGP